MNYSKEEAEAIFTAYDREGDGHMDVESFQKMSLALAGVRLTKEQAINAVRIIDLDGNGTIEFEEFYEFWKDGGNNDFKGLAVPDRILRKMENVYQLFKELDLDGNGTLDRNEIKILLENAHLNDEQLDEFWNEIDLDGNGVISFAEFIVLVVNSFLDEE